MTPWEKGSAWLPGRWVPVAPSDRYPNGSLGEGIHMAPCARGPQGSLGEEFPWLPVRGIPMPPFYRNLHGHSERNFQSPQKWGPKARAPCGREISITPDSRGDVRPHSPPLQRMSEGGPYPMSKFSTKNWHSLPAPRGGISALLSAPLPPETDTCCVSMHVIRSAALDGDVGRDVT